MPAFLLNPLIRYIAIGVVIAALFGWAIWERHDAIAAAKGEAAARLESDLHAQDAARWKAASDVRDGAITILNGKLAEQSAAAEKLRFARDQADQAQATAEAQTRDARAAFDQRISEIEAEVKAHPDQVVPLGAITRNRAPHLFDKDTPPGV